MISANITGYLSGASRLGLVAVLLPALTSMFLHGSWMHVIGNMWFLWIFGDNIEDYLGHFKYLAFYLASGMGAAFAQVILNPHSAVPTVGASGAIAGVLGAYFVLYPRSRIVTLVPLFFIPWFVEIPAIAFLLIWFLMQLLNGTMELSAHAGRAGGIAWWAHT